MTSLPVAQGAQAWSREQRYTALEQVPADTLRELQAQVAASPWRQGYHVQPPTGLLNDPNGFCFWRGQYHLFYQWFPLGPVHGLKYWRHVTSPDLLHWEDLGVGIAPDTPYDSHGAYSGSAWPLEDELLIAYTGNHRDAAWQRTPYQLTAHWNGTLHKDAPFLSGPPAGYTEHVRDPKLWAEEGEFFVVLGAQREDETGAALVLRSPDAREWSLVGELHTGLREFGYMWECPDLFHLDGADVLLICPQGLPSQGERWRNVYQSGYLLGQLDRETWQLTHGDFAELDGGFDFYAPQTTLGAGGERLLVGWMGLPDMTYPTDTHGWAHCLTLPRVLSVEGGQLRQRPWPGLVALRGEAQDAKAKAGERFELLLRPGAGPFSLDLRVDGPNYTRLSFDGEWLIFDRSHSGELPELDKAGLDGGKGGHIRRVAVHEVRELRIFSDTSSLEVFVNDGEQVLSGRIFPGPDAAWVRWEGSGECTVWPLGETE
ncbi:invertase [Deinococcus piscis]|uniref:Sucrose-6-phosphate hydrolase n=1 Tax=Deinococcus piscis TaxID=394230 RepID=A0ABQ3K763_9DEIO|nr:sucrose-6-phosphate hydrolase [Deinococcus piscis]GHG06389.1 invertase [Deinococcus piscis]